MDVRVVKNWPLHLINQWVAYCEIAADKAEKAAKEHGKVGQKPSHRHNRQR